MSLLLDAFGPTDVGAYTLLSRSLSASSTLAGSTATALATADDAGPMCCTTCTSHRGPVPAAKGRDGAVLGVEMPAAVGSACPKTTPKTKVASEAHLPRGVVQHRAPEGWRKEGW